MKKVVALTLDGVMTFDLACAVQAFRHGPGKTGEPSGFEMRTCGLRPGPVWTPSGFELRVEHGLDAQRTACARELLESTQLPVEVVAAQSGFGSVTALRVHLRAATGATPASQRRTLRRRPA